MEREKSFNISEIKSDTGIACSIVTSVWIIERKKNCIAVTVTVLSFATAVFDCLVSHVSDLSVLLIPLLQKHDLNILKIPNQDQNLELGFGHTQTNSMKLLRVWSFEFGGRSNYCDIIWLHRFLYCAVRTSCCFSRNWSGRRNHPVWQVYVIDDLQTWTSGQKAMSHIAKTSQQFTYNFQWIPFFSKPRRLSGNFFKLYTTMALRARSRQYWKLNFSPRCPAFQNWARKETEHKRLCQA